MAPFEPHPRHAGPQEPNGHLSATVDDSEVVLGNMNAAIASPSGLRAGFTNGILELASSIHSWFTDGPQKGKSGISDGGPLSPQAQEQGRAEPDSGLHSSADQSSGEDTTAVTAAAPSTRIENIMLGSWNFVSGCVYFLGSIFGVTFVLAWIATIPVVQLLTLGFLVEVTHRIIDSGRLRDGIVGREKGWCLFKLLIGVSLSLIPLYLISHMRFDAWLISPGSRRYHQLLRWETGFLVFTILHLLGAGLCGARLRHFLWPVLLPWSIGSGSLKWVLRRSPLRQLVDVTAGRWFPQTTERYFHSEPLSQWFVPAVLWRHVRRGTLLSDASQRFWQFVESLRLAHYAKQGFGALLGVTMWFAGPTFWILTSTRSIDPGAQGIFYVFFLLHLFLVLLYFPFVHARYCQTLKLRSYFEWRKAGRTFQYSPMRLTIAMLFSLLLSTPLWFMRIAMVPYDLWWIFSIFYIALLWPAWMLWGWGTHHGIDQTIHPATEPQFLSNSSASSASWSFQEIGSLESAEIPTGRKKSSFVWIWLWRTLFTALVMVQLFLTVLSIYVCWQGSFNILLHPMFNIPTPFGPNA